MTLSTHGGQPLRTYEQPVSLCAQHLPGRRPSTGPSCMFTEKTLFCFHNVLCKWLLIILLFYFLHTLRRILLPIFKVTKHCDTINYCNMVWTERIWKENDNHYCSALFECTKMNIFLTNYWEILCLCRAGETPLLFLSQTPYLCILILKWFILWHSHI